MAVIEEAFGSHAAFNQVVQEMFGQMGRRSGTQAFRQRLGSYMLQPVRTLLRATTQGRLSAGEEEDKEEEEEQEEGQGQRCRCRWLPRCQWLRPRTRAQSGPDTRSYKGHETMSTTAWNSRSGHDDALGSVTV